MQKAARLISYVRRQMMRAKDYRVMHDKMRIEISTGLSRSFIQIIEHKYDYESFGLWWFTFRHTGKQFRIVFDGKDDLLSVQEKIEKITGPIWKDTVSLKTHEPDTDIVLKYVLSATKAP